MTMLRILLIAGALAGLSPMPLAAQGIEFEHLSWAEALEKAQSENKLIFMDAYTVWCGPCKMMAKQTFPDPEAGLFFNANFINLKVDMEKDEGIELSQRFGVEYFPTLLFIDSAGAMIHKAVGYQSATDLITLGKKAYDPARNLRALGKRYKQGERAPEFLFAYLEARAAAYDPQAGALADEYLKTQANLNTPANMDVIYQYVNNPYSEGFASLIKNRETFEEKYGKKNIADKIEGAFNDYIMQRPEITLEEIRDLFTTVYPINGARLSAQFSLTYYRQRSDHDNFAKAAVDYLSRYEVTDFEELNDIAWAFYADISDKKLLKKAIIWAKKSVELQETYYNRDTLAALYFKLGNKKQARKNAERSIELAKTVGEDYSRTQALLDTINQQ